MNLDRVAFYLFAGLYLALVVRNPGTVSEVIDSSAKGITSVFGTLLGD